MMQKYYFAILNESTTAAADNQIVGWSAIEADTLPTCGTAAGMKAVQLPEMNASDWDDLTQGRKGSVALSDGKIVPYTPPPPPLKEQATTAMQNVQQQAAMTSAMGEVFGPQMQAYVRALRAIISGTDTTSTTLPTAPADPTT